MERSAWTDERLDDRFDQIDRRFDQIDGRLDRLEAEMRQGFAELRIEIAALRADLGGQIESLRSTLFRQNVTLTAGFLGLIAAILWRGA